MKLFTSFDNMINRTVAPIYRVIWFFAVCICFVSPSGLKDLHPATSTVKTLTNDTPHEEIHSQNGTSLHNHMGSTNSNTAIDLTTHKSPRINTEKARPSNTTNLVKNGSIIPVEGGVISVPDISKLKTTNADSNKQHKTVSHKMVTDLVNQVNKTVTDNKTTELPLHINITSSEAPKFNHSIAVIATSPLPPSQSPTTNSSVHKRRKKPLFTMVPSDESKESDSFIESSTTGRDYVLPIVLIILALPLVGYIIKLIYRRGTEFTERQQYHRMYLIDGMYNTR